MGAVILVTCNTDAIDDDEGGIYVATTEQLERWANKAVRFTSLQADHGDQLELSVAYLDVDGMQALNKQYRDVDRPTNFAHLLVHGVLHLAGMDHHIDNEAQAMEQLEIQILSSLDIPDPYNSVFKQSK